MGSLVPGWDAELGCPRGLAPDNDSIDKEPKPEGYFARLRSHRHSHGGSDELSYAPSLSRVSAPMAFTRSSTLQPSKQPPSQASRSSTMARGSPNAGKTILQPHKYQFTDWSEELTTLRKKGTLGRASVGSSEGGHGHGGGDGKGASTWWRELEVGHLNDHPDAVPNSNQGAHSTFVPQFVPASKLEFGNDAK